jgi:transcriptional regulator with XRE-family HTH domain
MSEDMDARGWTASDMASKAGIATSTVTRFLKGEYQTAPTAKKLAKALGYMTARRYVVRRVEQELGA